MRILYLGQKIEHVHSGADAVNFRNIGLLQQCTTDAITFFEPEAGGILDKLTGYIGGLNRRMEKKVIEMLSRGEYDCLFLSQSLSGRIAPKVKKHCPYVTIICCYHNIERHYAWEFLRTSGWIHFPFYFGAVYNERLAARYVDRHIVLNNRDAGLLKSIYGRSADLILPVAYEDAFDESACLSEWNSTQRTKPSTYLFVGSAFFANLDGLRWFVRNVMPHVAGRLVIAGKGMEEYRDEFSSDRVEVKGFVENLAGLYYSADLVVMPIFSGGGMKTKTAEALMYGKLIVGTTEAFEGYMQNTDATLCCRTAEQFISTINKLDRQKSYKPYYNEARRLFLDNYCISALTVKFTNFISRCLY